MKKKTKNLVSFKSNTKKKNQKHNLKKKKLVKNIKIFN